MSFAPILEQIVEGCGGGVAAALMGNDGIPIDEVSRPGAGLLAGGIEAAGTEFGRILDEIRKASDAIGGGAVGETTVLLSQATLVFRIVDDDTFLVVALEPQGNLGKARYLIRKHLLALRQLL
jgi:predicted regulator of Ras-like GTPase activity (Roadblock/LC7/MglB family)